MDKILDVIKEKLESPILTNFFIGLLLFNKKVVYAALATNYNDKIAGYYWYNKEKFESEIELFSAIHNDESFICLDPSWNLFGLPIIYALLITVALPYIKSILKTLSENADNFYDFLRMKINKISSVSLDTYLKLKEDYNKLLTDKDQINTNYYASLIYKSDAEKKADTIEIEKIELLKDIDKIKKEKEDIVKEKEDISKEYNEVVLQASFKEQQYKKRLKTIEEIFNGTWKLKVISYAESSKLNTITQYIKIVNGCEWHISNDEHENFQFSCYIDRYQYIKNDGETYDENNELVDYDVIKFKKSYTTDNNEIIQNEYSICTYSLINDYKVIGKEQYFNSNENNTPIEIDIILEDILPF